MTPSRLKHILIPALLLTLLASLPGCDAFQSHTPEEHIQRAKDFEDSGNLKGSIIELKNALQKNPSSAEARLLLGQVYLQAGMGADAEKELLRAKELGIAQAALQADLARSLIQQGNFTEALEYVVPFDQATPRQRAQLLNLRGEAQLGLRQIESGCASFREALQIDSTVGEAHRGLARCAMHQKDVATARSHMQSAIRTGPNAVENWMLLGEIELNQNNLDAARKSFAKAIALQPENRSARLKHALTALAMKDATAAREDLVALRKSAPNSADLLYLDTAFKYHEGNYQAALPGVQKLLNIQPDHVQANLLAGLIFYELKSYQQAISHLSKVVNRDPARAEARMYLASAQLISRDTDAAYRTLIPIALSSQDPQVLAMLAEIQRRRGESDQAIASLTEAKHLAPGNANILTRLAHMHFQAGDDAEGFAELQAIQDKGNKIDSADVLQITELIKKKRLAEAMGVVNRIIQGAPDNAQAYNLKGMVLISAGDTRGAYASFEKAHSLNPDAIAAILNLSQLDRRSNTRSKSIERLGRYVEKHPEHAQALTTLAELETEQGTPKMAQKRIDQALKADAGHLPAHALRVNGLISSGQLDQALSAARTAVGVAPTNPLALSLLADVQYAQNDMVNAEATYAKLAQTAATPRLLYRLATAQAATGKPAAAIATLEKSRQRAPGDLETLSLLSNLRLAQKNFGEAQKIVAELKQRFPASATGLYQEGQLLLAQGQTDSALDAYRQAHRVANDSRSVTYLHAALTRVGKADEANALLRNWLAQHPKDIGVYHQLAASLVQDGRSLDAIEQYRQILKQVPNDVLALNNLAALHQAEGKPGKALAYAEKAAKIAPRNPLVLDTLGWTQVQIGQADKGIATLRAAYAARPDNAEIALHLATALAQQGNKREARSIVQAALRTPSPQQEALAALLKRL